MLHRIIEKLYLHTYMINNSCLSWMRRTIALVRDYSTKRKAFGQFLKDKPLYVEVLNDMEISFRGNLIFLLHVSSLLGKFELDKATSDEQHLLRMLTPILKLYSAKECLKIVSEGLECFGGQGYIESTFLPVMLRDAQVASIWEGTTNVLCLDFIKSLKSKDQLEAFGKKFRETMFKLVNSDGRFLNNNYILTAYGKLIIAYNMLYGDLDELISKKDTFARFEQHLRKICYGFAQIYIAMLLADHLIKSGLTKDCIVFTKWVELKALYKSIDPNRSGQEYRKYSRLIGLDDDDKQRFSMLIDGVEKSKLIRAKM